MIDPAELIEILETTDVIGELDRVGAMMVSVVFDGELDVLPTHVEVIPPIAVRARAPESASAAAGNRRESAEAATTFPSATARPRPRGQARSSSWRRPRVLPMVDAAGLRPSGALKSVAARQARPGARPRRRDDPSGRGRTRCARAWSRPGRRAAGSRLRATDSVASDNSLGARALRQINSTGESSSIHFAPCSADAASPATTASRPRPQPGRRRCADEVTASSSLIAGRHSA